MNSFGQSKASHVNCACSREIVRQSLARMEPEAHVCTVRNNAQKCERSRHLTPRHATINELGRNGGRALTFDRAETSGPDEDLYRVTTNFCSVCVWTTLSDGKNCM